MCIQSNEPSLTLSSLISAPEPVVYELVHRWKAAEALAAVDLSPSSPGAGSSEAITDATVANSAAESADGCPKTATTTVALTASLCLAVLACFAVFFWGGWYCRGKRVQGAEMAFGHPLKRVGAVGVVANERTSKVPVAVLDLEKASVPAPPGPGSD